MQLWVGLGNPGSNYRLHRHNIGFMALDRIAERHGFSPWRARFNGEVAEGKIDGESILLLKPLTFMNLSGRSVVPAMQFYKLSHEDIFVFHDEMDLPWGKCRVKKGGGIAGHNGLRSIRDLSGKPDYWRIRLGVGHPGDRALVVSYVMGNFPEDQRKDLSTWLDYLSDECSAIAQGKPDMLATKLAEHASHWAGAPVKEKKLEGAALEKAIRDAKVLHEKEKKIVEKQKFIFEHQAQNSDNALANALKTARKSKTSN
ncbi:aminoacyl-tRNA hydrolase [Acetobacteraceae bacterium]|nr:aminoacyl-tRNA hydrolase [Acetobacteraceae bacterium]